MLGCGFPVLLGNMEGACAYGLDKLETTDYFGAGAVDAAVP